MIGQNSDIVIPSHELEVSGPTRRVDDKMREVTTLCTYLRDGSVLIASARWGENRQVSFPAVIPFPDVYGLREKYRWRLWGSQVGGVENGLINVQRVAGWNVTFRNDAPDHGEVCSTLTGFRRILARELSPLPGFTVSTVPQEEQPPFRMLVAAPTNESPEPLRIPSMENGECAVQEAARLLLRRDGVSVTAHVDPALWFTAMERAQFLRLFHACSETGFDTSWLMRKQSVPAASSAGS
jgi:hypothetical protein